MTQFANRPPFGITSLPLKTVQWIKASPDAAQRFIGYRVISATELWLWCGNLRRIIVTAELLATAARWRRGWTLEVDFTRGVQLSARGDALIVATPLAGAATATHEIRASWVIAQHARQHERKPGGGAQLAPTNAAHAALFAELFPARDYTVELPEEQKLSIAGKADRYKRIVRVDVRLADRSMIVHSGGGGSPGIRLPFSAVQKAHALREGSPLPVEAFRAVSIDSDGRTVNFETQLSNQDGSSSMPVHYSMYAADLIDLHKANAPTVAYTVKPENRARWFSADYDAAEAAYTKANPPSIAATTVGITAALNAVAYRLSPTRLEDQTLSERDIVCPTCRRYFCTIQTATEADIAVNCPGCIAEGRAP